MSKREKNQKEQNSIRKVREAGTKFLTNKTKHGHIYPAITVIELYYIFAFLSAC